MLKTEFQLRQLFDFDRNGDVHSACIENAKFGDDPLGSPLGHKGNPVATSDPHGNQSRRAAQNVLPRLPVRKGAIPAVALFQ